MQRTIMGGVRFIFQSVKDELGWRQGERDPADGDEVGRHGATVLSLCGPYSDRSQPHRHH